MKTTRLAAFLGGMLAFAGAAAAQPPAAVVEDVTGKSAGVEMMDYVDVGKTIHLEPSDSLVLSYMKSCVRETITGGTVTVGAEQSDVQSGKVERTKVECDAGKMMLTAQQASQTASFVVRSLQVPAQKITRATIYALRIIADFCCVWRRQIGGRAARQSW